MQLQMERDTQLQLAVVVGLAVARLQHGEVSTVHLQEVRDLTQVAVVRSFKRSCMRVVAVAVGFRPISATPVTQAQAVTVVARLV
jgi:hypothetical protein